MSTSGVLIFSTEMNTAFVRAQRGQRVPIGDYM